MSLGGFDGLMLQKKIIKNDYKIVTTKEGLETTNNDLTLVLYCEFQREGFARDWLLLGLFRLIVLRTLQPCSAKMLAGSRGRGVASTHSYLKLYFNQSIVHLLVRFKSAHNLYSTRKRWIR